MTAAAPSFPPCALEDRQGALFFCHLRDPKVFEYIKIQMEMRNLPSRTNVFLSSAQSLCESDPSSLTDVVSITKATEISRASILRICSALTKLSLVKKQTLKTPGKRSTSLFVIRDDLPGVSFDISKKKRHGQQLELLSEQDNLAIHPTVSSYLHDVSSLAKGEHFSIFTLMSGLPSGKKGIINTKGHTTPIYVGKDTFNLTIRPDASGKVATVKDLQILSAIISLIYKQLKSGKQTKNPFQFLVVDILKELGYSCSGAMQNRVMDSLSRWESTGFTISNITKGFSDKYNQCFVIDTKFRMITRLSIASTRDANGVKSPRVVSISLSEDLLARIGYEDGRYLTSIHPDSYRETSPFDYKFYLWMRRAIRTQYTQKTFSLAHLHREIEAWREMKYFRRDIKAMITNRKKHKSIELCGYVYGYYIEAIDNTFNAFAIWADEHDKLLGELSRTRMRLQQKNGG